MKKLILTAVIAFAVGMLSMLNTTTSNQTAPVKTATVVFDSHITLATAD